MENTNILSAVIIIIFFSLYDILVWRDLISLHHLNVGDLFRDSQIVITLRFFEVELK